MLALCVCGANITEYMYSLCLLPIIRPTSLPAVTTLIATFTPVHMARNQLQKLLSDGGCAVADAGDDDAFLDVQYLSDARYKANAFCTRSEHV